MPGTQWASVFLDHPSPPPIHTSSPLLALSLGTEVDSFLIFLLEPLAHPVKGRYPIAMSWVVSGLPDGRPWLDYLYIHLRAQHTVGVY